MDLRERLFSAIFFILYGAFALAQTGIGTTNPVNKFQVEAGLADPATSGSGSNGALRLSGTSGNHVLDFGLSSSSTYSWLQSRDRTNYAGSRVLSLNPRGGNVGIGSTAPAATLEIGATDGSIPGYLILNATTTGSGVEGGEINIRPAPISLSPAAQIWTIDQVSNAGVPRLRIFPSSSGEARRHFYKRQWKSGHRMGEPRQQNAHLHLRWNRSIYRKCGR